jgi:hypothetical protein
MGSRNWKQLRKTIGTIFVDLGKLSFGTALAIVFFVVGVFIPLFAMALFAMYKERQEDRKEHQVHLHTQNP